MEFSRFPFSIHTFIWYKAYFSVRLLIFSWFLIILVIFLLYNLLLVDECMTHHSCVAINTKIVSTDEEKNISTLRVFSSKDEIFKVRLSNRYVINWILHRIFAYYNEMFLPDGYIQLFYPIPYPLTERTYWPINEDYSSNIIRRKNFPCSNIHV